MRLSGALACLLPLLLAAGACAQHDRAGVYSAPAEGKPLCTLRIQVTGFRNDRGLAGGAVYPSASGWPEDTRKAIVHGGFPIAGGHATEVFEVPPGLYGVVAIHDENRNRKLDKNLFAIPKEGFGFANNPRVLLSAPSFQTASVRVGCPVTEIGIRLIYK